MKSDKLYVSRKRMNLIATAIISTKYNQNIIIDDVLKKTIGLSETEFAQNLNALQSLGAVTVSKDAMGREVLSVQPALYMTNLIYKEESRKFWFPIMVSIAAVIVSIISLLF